MGEWIHRTTFFLTSALVGGEWSVSRPGRFTPGEGAPGTYWIGGWVGPRAGLGRRGEQKILHPTGIRTQNSRPSSS
jgi:hypothetical protein